MQIQNQTQLATYVKKIQIGFTTMNVFVIELVENLGTESQVAYVASSLERAIQWMRDEGMDYGGFYGFESFGTAHYAVLEYTLDSNDFAGHGNYTVSGSVFV
jgi:hypothetical protein